MGLIVALPAMAVLFVLNKRFKGKQKGKQRKATVAIFTLVVAFAVGCGIAFSFLGRWFAAFVTWLSHLLSSLTNQHLTGPLTLALTVLALLWATADVMYDRKADKGAQFAVILLPTLLALVVGGQLGASGGNAVQTTFDQMFHLVGQMGGS
jgi:uncharacterized membrane protein